MTNKEKALVEKLEQEINNDIDMNVETEQFISTDNVIDEFVKKGYKGSRVQDELFNDVIRISW